MIRSEIRDILVQHTRSGLIIGSELRMWRAVGLKPDSTKYPPYKCVWIMLKRLFTTAANSVVALHAIPFFSPTIYAGQLRPLHANKSSHFQSIRPPPSSIFKVKNAPSLPHMKLIPPLLVYSPSIQMNGYPDQLDFQHSAKQCSSSRRFFALTTSLNVERKNLRVVERS
ncbi:hypothetical protein AVEN_258719-1 [Araneus ventricosus]|uniref:Uncharacterized protein n=1 Tax=Araneus ventricosus TaxID=182803 RepID=A0A4Y2LL11_ARAVE|nr:hypothetical protein AVEN_258719-1 [Araneus ventricosus]